MVRIWILCAVAAALAAGCAGAPPAKPQPKTVSFAIRKAMDYETAGFQKTRVPVEDPRAREYVWVSPKIELDEMDIEDANVTHLWTGTKEEPRREAAVAVTMTAQGRKKLKALTTERGYSRLALFVNDRLVMASYVRSPITNGEMLIYGGLDDAEAARLAVALSGRRHEPRFVVPQ